MARAAEVAKAAKAAMVVVAKVVVVDVEAEKSAGWRPSRANATRVHEPDEGGRHI